jgi:hypothetical protein
MGKAAREILAIAFWVYVIVKLFVFDLDVYLATEFLPHYAWLLDLKFFILIGIMALVLIFTKNKGLVLWSAYTVFYPAILIFWRVPVFLYNQESWILTLAVINAVIFIFHSVRFIFIGSSLFLISLAIVIVSSSEPFLWSAIGVILLLLLATYLHRLILVFRPSSIFQIHTTIFSGIREHGAKPFFILDESIKSADSSSQCIISPTA